MLSSLHLPIANMAICPGNCSGNGVCLSGVCLCQVQFSGWSCSDHNLGYFVSFGVFFYVVCLMAIVQLVLCIRSDFFKLKRPNILKACRINIQKLIYLMVICACGSRAVYFTLGLHDLIPHSVKENLFSTFYPFVMSGFSLLICFWAESFHLSGLQLDQPRFLTKSYCGFVAFNLLVYVMLTAQVISNHVLSVPNATKMNEMFNGGFAFLMFFVLVVFLIYGVEIFYKVEGAFKPEESLKEGRIDIYQLFQSRLGLVAQAALQLAVTMFLMSEVLGKLWKQKMSIGDRNIVEIAFHLAELGCVLWFPCCLWNVSKPSELWILNPKKLLMLTTKESQALVNEETPTKTYKTFQDKQLDVETLTKQNNMDYNTEDEEPDEISPVSECWICYDSDNKSPMIQPCNCKGGMKMAHHDCLKKWLVERPFTGSDISTISCSVCKEQYNVTQDNGFIWTPNGLQVRAWSQTFFVVVTMASLPVAIFFLWHKVGSPVKMALVGLLFLGECFFLRLFGFNFLKAYKITKTRALKILGRPEEVRTSPASSVLSEANNEHLMITVDT